MSLSLAIAVIVLADLALIGLLAFVMSRAKLLTSHVSASQPATQAATSQPPATRPLRSSRHATPAHSAGLAARA